MRLIFHVDMDSFYTAVEIRNKPDLKDKPVVVGADPKEGKGRGVVSAASYAARKFGIKSAMPISKAYKLCPSAVFLPVNMPLYVEVSTKVMDLLRAYSEKFEQVSVDEAFLDVSDKCADFAKAERFAINLQKGVLEKECLSCSVGVGPNKLIAKIASDFKKPFGITVVQNQDVSDFLKELPVIKIPYIGPKTSERLKTLGVSTVSELSELKKDFLVSQFGKFGNYLYDSSRGVDENPVLEHYEIKSINRNITFEKDTVDVAFLNSILNEMAAEIREQLDSEGLVFKTVGLRVRYSNFETFTRAVTLDDFSSEKSAMVEKASNLLKEFLDKRLIRQLGLRVSTLKKKDKVSSQRSIFDFG